MLVNTTGLYRKWYLSNLVSILLGRACLLVGWFVCVFSIVTQKLLRGFPQNWLEGSGHGPKEEPDKMADQGMFYHFIYQYLIGLLFLDILTANNSQILMSYQVYL